LILIGRDHLAAQSHEGVALHGAAAHLLHLLDQPLGRQPVVAIWDDKQAAVIMPSQRCYCTLNRRCVMDDWGSYLKPTTFTLGLRLGPQSQNREAIRLTFPVTILRCADDVLE